MAFRASAQPSTLLGFVEQIENLHGERAGLQRGIRDLLQDLRDHLLDETEAAKRRTRINAEIADVRADIRALEADAVHQGFSLDILRQVIRLRAMAPDQLERWDMTLAMYRRDLGIEARP